MEKDRQHVQTIVTKYYELEIIKDLGNFKRQKKYKKQHNKDEQQCRRREREEKEIVFTEK